MEERYRELSDEDSFLLCFFFCKVSWKATVVTDLKISDDIALCVSMSTPVCVCMYCVRNPFMTVCYFVWIISIKQCLNWFVNSWNN